MWGASSPHVKLTGDLANVSDAIRIGDCFPFRNFAKNQSPCNFRLLQQYRSTTDIRGCSKTLLFDYLVGKGEQGWRKGQGAARFNSAQNSRFTVAEFNSFVTSSSPCQVALESLEGVKLFSETVSPLPPFGLPVGAIAKVSVPLVLQLPPGFTTIVPVTDVIPVNPNSTLRSMSTVQPSLDLTVLTT
jgi:hypothetical protein